MRVITGRAKGRKLKVPAGPDIRPITDQIKEALFNTIGPYLEGVTFLDLFAGSGAVGIEALSRYADEAVFVEMNPQATAIIKENLELCQLEAWGTIIRGDVFRTVSRLARAQRKFDIIYADPPFRQKEYFGRIANLLGAILADGGTAILRSPKSIVLPVEAEGLSRYRSSVYGDSVLNYYRVNTMD